MRGPRLPSSERSGNGRGVPEPAPRRVDPGCAEGGRERAAWAPGRRRGGRRGAVRSGRASLASPRLRAAIGKPRAAERDS